MFSRFALGFGYLIFLLIAGLLVLGVHFMSATVPRYTGSATVAGISGNVDIDRDSYAIPHIHATTERDAYFGLGYAEAQDRLFQMELERRLGEGRMSEVFGPRSLPLDEWARTIGFSRIADQMWRKSGKHTREILSAFCSGINAYLGEHRTHLGFTFDALGLVPENWKPQDCLVIGRLMAWEMNFSALTDAAYSDFSLALDSAHLHALFPFYPTDGATVLGGPNPDMFVSNYLAVPVSGHYNSFHKPALGPPSKPPKPAGVLPAAKPRPQAKPHPHLPVMRRIGMSGMAHSEYAGIFQSGAVFDSAIGAFLGGGSNSFVAAPSKTASGAALLENDTHLQLGSPSRWYLAHLTSDDGLNVAGFLIPGLPVILSGRSPNLAWGITSGMADECDYFVEKLDSTGTRYLLPNGTSRPFDIIHDTILVRDMARVSDNSTLDPLHRVPFEVRLTVNGPVMTGMHPDSLARSFQGDERAGGIPKRSIFNRTTRPVAMMWNGSYALSDELAGWLALPRATSVTEARVGMSGFATPCLNLCLADTHGNISYQYIGRLPRRSGSEERLLLPRDGTNPADAWQGFIPMRDLPHVTNPARGYIVSANNPPVAHAPIPFGLDWEPDSRADRLSELLQTDTAKLDVAAARKFQMDIISPYNLRRVLPYLLALYPNPNPPSIAPDSTWAFRIDSMRLSWKEDSLARFTSITDSAMQFLREKDSAWLAQHRPQTEKLRNGNTLDPFTARVLTYLRNWDGGMRSDEIAPAIYSVFLNRLLFNTFRNQLGTQRYAEFIYLDNIPLQTLADILPDTANIWWHPSTIENEALRMKNKAAVGDTAGDTLSDTSSSASSSISHLGSATFNSPCQRDSIIQTSFRESLRILALTFGRDIRQWQWGRMHTLTFRHPFDKAGKLVASFVDIPAGPMPGGPTTVLQGTYYLWNPYAMQIGPSMRMVTDMSQPILYGVLPTGNSEAIFGDHYKDMLPLYKRGKLIRISLTERNPKWKRFELRPQAE